MIPYGQSLIEYALVFSAVILVLIFGVILFRAGMQGRWLDTAEQAGTPLILNANYSVETLQESGRREVTGDLNQVKNHEYVVSTIIGSNEDEFSNNFLSEIGGKSNYQGHERTVTDFVDANINSQQKGTHTAINLGKVRDKGLFDQ